MQNTDDKIYFNFTYFAIKLLGKGLYSNAWTAIAELVANGFDAGAKTVKIYVDMTDKEHSIVEIFDDGTGMGYSDLAEKYTFLGRDKRADEAISENLKQQLMGRKGIGKLAALYLSNKYYIISKTKNDPETIWCLDSAGATDSDMPCLQHLPSLKIETKNQWDTYLTGTMIHLTNVDLKNFGQMSIAGFKARLSDFYLLEALTGHLEVCIRKQASDPIHFECVEKSVAFKNMYAMFDNTEINFKTHLAKYVTIHSNIEEVRDKKRDVQILDCKDFQTSGEKNFYLDNGELSKYDIPYKMTGWIGIHASIRREDAILNDENYLRNKVYRPNQLRLYVRKKLAIENFLDYVKNTQAFSNYIEGEISFDVLDDNRLSDIATSNRQGFPEDNDRIELLINIVKPIIGKLIRLRSSVGLQVKQEEKEYSERQLLIVQIAEQEEREQYQKAEMLRKKAETEKKQEIFLRKQAEIRRFAEIERRRMAEESERKAAEAKKIAEEKAKQLKSHLGSEKKRNEFLFESMDENQIDFAKKLHMLKINVITMQTILKNAIMKLQRGKYSEKKAWETLEKISYSIARIKAVLSYSAIAKFDTKDELMQGDMFQFIYEYCNTVLINESVKIKAVIVDRAKYNTKFAPQDIAILLENVLSNSQKHAAKNLIIQMEDRGDKILISLKDDGSGIEQKLDNVDELFEFGKGYTKPGTGIGLYHVREIVEQKLHGKINIVEDLEPGFELLIRI
jgi:signal transduction histidine kinase